MFSEHRLLCDSQENKTVLQLKKSAGDIPQAPRTGGWIPRITPVGDATVITAISHIF